VKSWQYFRTHGIPLNSASNSLSCDIVRFKIEVGVDAKFICKNVPLNDHDGHFDNGAMRQPCFRLSGAQAAQSMQLGCTL